MIARQFNCHTVVAVMQASTMCFAHEWDHNSWNCAV